MIQLNSDSIKVKENGTWSSLASLTGPQGEKGETGATGAQGPQGIPGQDGAPGYPTISAGDAGKVLTVNGLETDVEWGEPGTDGLVPIYVTQYNSSWQQQTSITQDELTLVNTDPSKVYIAYKYHEDDSIFKPCFLRYISNYGSFYEYHYTVCFPSSGEFSINYENEIRIRSTNGDLQYGNYIVRPYQDSGTYNTDKGFDLKATGSIFTAPAIKNVNGSIYDGWKIIPQAGDGLELDTSTGELNMQVPLEKEEVMEPTTITFDSSWDVYGFDSNYNEFYFNNENNSAKCSEIFDYLWSAQPSTVDIDIEYTYEGNTYTESITCTNVDYNIDSWETISFGDEGESYFPTGILRIWYRKPGLTETNDGVEIKFESSNCSVSYISFNDIYIGTGTYEYTSQLPIEAIECDESNDGSYIIQTEVSSEGVTYSWVEAPPTFSYDSVTGVLSITTV